MDSYQLVSKHSILGSQLETSHGKSEAEEVEKRIERMEGLITQLKEIIRFWKRRTKSDGCQSRRDHAPCRRRRNKLSEKDFEIYLDQKLLMLQQFYVTQKTGRPNEEKDTEPEAANVEKGELKEISEKEKKLVGFGWSQNKVDLTFNLMGQAHKFIITPAIFANNRGVLQGEKDTDKKKLVGSDSAQNPRLSVSFKVDASVFGSVEAPKIDVDVSAIVVSFSKNREATILFVLLKSTVGQRAFDPGDSSSISCTAWASCFKLWDPGGSVLIVRFDIFTLRTR